ncbi:hypothetical protein ALC60_08471 [Trachymyrmex zeteki]|uniref:DUF8207 domain-containing protein n=1 Tax=Mycetomoellerius zeteki TaxID=64791 RepID=A0A151WWZ8_9HYME|nr:hypothetical protein ALC60_08471 [Trachymyrmex zeteki]
MCTDEESRRTSVTSFSLQTLTHLVNIPSLLVEALPRFERQRQFMSAMISQGDLHNVETYTLYSFFTSFDALLSLAKYIFQSFVQAGINKTDRIRINCGVYNTSKIEEGAGRPPISKNFEQSIFVISIQGLNVKWSLSSTSVSHSRFSRPLTYIRATAFVTPAAPPIKDPSAPNIGRNGNMPPRFAVRFIGEYLVRRVSIGEIVALRIRNVVFSTRRFPTMPSTRKNVHKYKSMLLMTNAHKHKHHLQGRLLSNREYKYKHVIAPLMSITPKKQKKKFGKGLPHAMTLNDNAIDYVHWDDPNELVDLSSERRRLVGELHAPVRRNFPRRRVIVRGYDDLWQADIVELRPYSS